MTYVPIYIPCLLSCLCFFICYTQARLHHHHHHHHHNHHDHENKHMHLSSSPSNSSYICDGDGIFDVREFGAIGDGVEDDTKAFKKAWDCTCKSQSQNESQDQPYSSILLVPHGYSFIIQSIIFTGPCQSPLIIQVDGTLMPPNGPDSWPKNNNRHKWLVFYRVNHMTIKGKGLIDGRGQQWWNLPCKPHKGPNGSTLRGPCDSPSAIRFLMCTNLTLQELKIKDSPHFNLRFDRCLSVHVESINIVAPTSSPNTDGIHIENTKDVKIHNSIISNGDDCVSIGSGCYDVDIKNITCVHGHGISIGSLGNHNSGAWVSNITVWDSTIKKAKNGVRIKTWQGGYGAVNRVKYENILMENVRNPIIIDQFYCPMKRCSNQTSAVVVSDIKYRNIKGTYDARSPPMHFGCSDSIPCRNITLSEVELFPVKRRTPLDVFCWNAYGETEKMIIPSVYCLLDETTSKMIESTHDYN